MRNGYRINIGDTPVQVLSKLGERPQFSEYNFETKTHTWMYWKLIQITSPLDRGKKGKKREYSAYYKFRNQRLWSIMYFLDDAEIDPDILVDPNIVGDDELWVR